MGVPKFFRWLGERYPMILQSLHSATLPHIDNLYLDMNGIIHKCTHSDDTGEHTQKRPTESEMMLKIFKYIDKLFQAIKPKKHFFMAIDGVAPRAKMNQQRARRFRSAKEAQKARDAAISRNETVPDIEDIFDSNCITPGTEFMAKLSEHLDFFIKKKVQEDTAWRQCKIVFSGHEVPGEGEHKIMEFIRGRKSQKKYSPNETHCMYGLDADLIMLSLVSHEPHFMLLREVIDFKSSKNNKKKKNKEEREILSELVLRPDEFQLLHISLLREYLDMEFSTTNIQDYNLERIIDDFILMAFFVGNDFLPHLPTIDIREGAFDIMFQVYKKHLNDIGGYLTHAGKIQFNNLERFLKLIAERESEILQDRVSGELDFARGKKRKKSKGAEQRRKARREEEQAEDALNNFEISIEKENKSEDIETETDEELATETDTDSEVIDEDESSASFTEEPLSKQQQQKQQDENELSAPVDLFDTSLDMPSVAEEYFKKSEDGTSKPKDDSMYLSSLSMKEGRVNIQKWKEQYYEKKVGVSLNNREGIRQLVKQYLEGLIWVLSYYYEGCISWKWFFPYHYAPMASELTDLAGIAKTIDFELGQPFLPFQQLMGVLPEKSQHLLPEPYRWLMKNTDSPIIDFYPQNFEIDMDDAKYEWEGVVILPFIEEERLRDAMSKINSKDLSKAERKRNSKGENYVYEYNNNTSYLCQSTLPGILSNINGCNVNTRIFQIPKQKPFKPKLLPGIRTGKDGIIGIPTFHSLNFSFKLEKVSVSIFGFPSKNPSMVICLETPSQHMRAANLAPKLMNTRIYSGYPFTRESIVSAVSDEVSSFEYSLKEHIHHEKDKESFQKEAKKHEKALLKNMALNVGNVDVLVYVKPLDGIQRSLKGHINKVFSDTPVAYPYQTIPHDWNPQDTQYVERPPKPVATEFPIGTEILYLGQKHFGARGVVMAHVNNRMQVGIVEPLDSPVHSSVTYRTPQFYDIKEVASYLRIPIRVLATLTSSLRVGDGKITTDIGLNIKFNRKDARVAGYARRKSAEPSAHYQSHYLQSSSSSFSKNRGSNNPFSFEMQLEDWELSEYTVQILLTYKKQFGEVFRYLIKASRQNVHPVENIFPDNPYERLSKLEEWLKQLPSYNQPLVPCNVSALSEQDVSQIESAAIDYNSQNMHRFNVAILENVSPVLLFNPSDICPTNVPVPTLEISDRVVNISGSGAVPFGLRGTVIGIRGNNAEILYDEEIMQGQMLGGKLKTRRGNLTRFENLLNLSRPSPRNPHQTPVVQWTKGVQLNLPDPLDYFKSQDHKPKQNKRKGKPKTPIDKYKGKQGKKKQPSEQVQYTKKKPKPKVKSESSSSSTPSQEGIEEFNPSAYLKQEYQRRKEIRNQRKGRKPNRKPKDKHYNKKPQQQHDQEQRPQQLPFPAQLKQPQPQPQQQIPPPHLVAQMSYPPTGYVHPQTQYYPTNPMPNNYPASFPPHFYAPAYNPQAIGEQNNNSNLNYYPQMQHYNIIDNDPNSQNNDNQYPTDLK